MVLLRWRQKHIVRDDDDESEEEQDTEPPISVFSIKGKEKKLRKMMSQGRIPKTLMKNLKKPLQGLLE